MHSINGKLLPMGAMRQAAHEDDPQVEAEAPAARKTIWTGTGGGRWVRRSPVRRVTWAKVIVKYDDEEESLSDGVKSLRITGAEPP